MEKQTQVKNIRLKSRASRLESPLFHVTQVEELPPRKSWRDTLLQFDRLARNLAVAGVLFVMVVAVRSAGAPQAQSVFGALQETSGMRWDENIGKLSFVHSLLPESVQSVWNEKTDTTVFSPVNGEIIHSWNRREPYVIFENGLKDVRASEDGEVMSIAHGPEEELIVRVRHENYETLYGNLASTVLSEGEKVYAGDVLGQLMSGRGLAFELRVDGRSIDPEGRLVPIVE